MKLRDYQQDAHDRTIDLFASHGSALMVMATGLGKTVTFAHVAKTMLAHGRVMIIAHMDALVRQAAKKIEAITGITPEIEMAEQHAEMSMWSSPVVVASKDSLVAGRTQSRIEKFNPDEFSLVIVDEAHRSVAPTFQKCIDHFRQNDRCKILGVTATPDRKDRKPLGDIFDEVACKLDLPWAIENGWLVPVRQRIVRVDELDFATVPTVNGDLSEAELSEMMEREESLWRVASPLMELAGDRSTMIFAVRVGHARLLAELMRREGRTAEYVSGNLDASLVESHLEAHRSGSLQFLSNCMKLTEGYDDPGLRLIGMARPTTSAALYRQMLGRGTRPAEAIAARLADASGPDARREMIAKSEKPYVEVLDFTGNTGKHKLVSAANVLGGDLDQRIIDRAKKLAEAASGDVQDQLEEAEKQIEDFDKEQSEALSLAEEMLAEERRRALRAKAKYTVEDASNANDAGPGISFPGGIEPPTPRMVEILKQNGVHDPMSLSRPAAGKIIAEIKWRREKGLCTLKQARILKKHGHDDLMTKQEASDVIDKIFGKAS